MFDIGFSELLLVFVIGLIVLGPQRLPVAVKTVVGWIRAMRSLAANVQNELAQELKLQELQDSLKKVEEAGKGTLSPELKESMEELRKTADSMKRTYHEATTLEKAEDEANAKARTSASETESADSSHSVPFASVKEDNSGPEHTAEPAVSHQTPASATAVTQEPAVPGQAGATIPSSGVSKPASDPGKVSASPVSEER